MDSEEKEYRQQRQQQKRDVKLARWAGPQYNQKSIPRRGSLARRLMVNNRVYRYVIRKSFFTRVGLQIVRVAPKIPQHRQARRLGLLGLPLARPGCFAPERPRKESRAKRLHRHMRWVDAVSAGWR